MSQSVERNIDIASVTSPLPEVPKLLYLSRHVFDLYLPQRRFVLLAQSFKVHHSRYVEAIPL
jgi:hypothetical protein